MTKRHDWTEAEDAILRDRFAAMLGAGVKIETTRTLS
jgi:hypothetical protein